MTAADLERALRELCVLNNWDFKETCKTIRVALTGSLTGSSIFRLMEILGPEETGKRLENFENYVKTLV